MREPSEDLIAGMQLVAALCGPMVLLDYHSVRSVKRIESRDMMRACPVCAAANTVVPQRLKWAWQAWEANTMAIGLPHETATAIVRAADEPTNRHRPLLLAALREAGNLIETPDHA